MTNFFIETIKKDPRVNSTELVKDMALLEPFTRTAVQAVIVDALAEGITLHVTETYRSQTRQRQLFIEGKTRLCKVGLHEYGLAADFCKIINGQASWAGDWTFLCRLAVKHGLISGGDWGLPGIPHSWRDWDHVQRVAVKDENKLFAGTWYPNSSYRPY